MSANAATGALAMLERTTRTLRLHLLNAGSRSPTANSKLDALLSSAPRTALYWWEPETAAAVLAASRSMPDDWQLAKQCIPNISGLWAFAEPVPVVVDPVEPILKNGVAALRWDVAVLNDRRTPAAVLGAFFEPVIDATDATIGVFGLDMLHWQVDTPIVDPADNSHPDWGSDWTFPQRSYDICRFFAAGLQFLSQEILVREPARLDRADRRRLMRAGAQYEPSISVVQLRRAPQAHDGPVEHRDVDWQVRWLVSGHWRRQWHPSLQAHQPHYILPYVKGPEDRPFRARPVVRDVRR